MLLILDLVQSCKCKETRSSDVFYDCQLPSLMGKWLYNPRCYFSLDEIFQVFVRYKDYINTNLFLSVINI